MRNKVTSTYFLLKTLNVITYLDGEIVGEKIGEELLDVQKTVSCVL